MFENLSQSFQATKQPEMRCKLVNNLITSMVFVAYLAGTLTYGQEDTKHVATSSGILTSLSSEFEINTIYCNRAMCNTGEAARGTIFVPAWSVPEWSRFSTGCPAIDGLLRGGIPLQKITEVAGPSGVGKTQLCLQLSLTVQLSKAQGGLEKGAIYICTEGAFPSKRLNQMAQKLGPDFPDNVLVYHAGDCESLLRCLNSHVPKILRYRTRNIGAIIIDSIAGAFRGDLIGVDYRCRTGDFAAIAAKLYELAERHDLAVVCANQVTDNPATNTTEPCLGPAWGNLVTYRLRMDAEQNGVRSLRAVFAQDIPDTQSCRFVIAARGVGDVMD